MSSFKNFHPFASTILDIIISNREGNSLNLLLKDKSLDCEFHRLELNESMFDIFPSGILIVKDQNDILTKLIEQDYDFLTFIFEDGPPVVVNIHSAQHITNAASRDEESYVGIHFSIAFYEFCQETTLSKIMGDKSPKVYRIDKFIEKIIEKVNLTETDPSSPLFERGPFLQKGIIDVTDNYVVYRPLNPKLDGTEVSSDSVADYINYLTNFAVPLETGSYGERLKGKPRFVSWVSWGNYLNFMVFYDLESIDTTLIDHRYAITNSDATSITINNKEYKKIYNYSTNQAAQYITKEYYYIRKTPKVLDYNHPEDINEYQHLNYQFQDSGEKHNIEIVSTSKGGFGTFNEMKPGAQELKYSGKWGYIDDATSATKESQASHIGGVLGESDLYNQMNFAGFTTYFNYYDHTEMWKNMFDLTPVDPFFSGVEYYTPSQDANTSVSSLQKVLDIRFKSQKEEKEDSTKSQLELIRKIEAQNFILYTLCCIGNEGEESSFFAKLHSFVYGITYDIQPRTQRNWLYTWTKIVPTIRRKEDGNTILNEPAGNTFSDYDMKHLRGWTYDLNETSGFTFDENNAHKFAININERGATGDINLENSFFNPGWAKPLGGFKYRPIGIKGNETIYVGEGQPTDGYSGPVSQIVRMYKKSWISLLSEAGVTLIDPSYIGKNLYYFSSENVLDGSCS